MEIKSCCCAFAKNLVEEVHVLKSDCPIKREEGQRVVNNKGQCTCIFVDNIFRKYEVPKCKYYNGTKYKRKDGGYFIQCSFRD